MSDSTDDDDPIRCQNEDCPATLRWTHDDGRDENVLLMFDGREEYEVSASAEREWIERGGVCMEHSPYPEDHYDG